MHPAAAGVVAVAAVTTAVAVVPAATEVEAQVLALVAEARPVVEAPQVEETETSPVASPLVALLEVQAVAALDIITAVHLSQTTCPNSNNNKISD